ncbi:Vps54-like protein-domain-containing protein [Rhypophila decipiens]|uniref:Vps54-like protein-domain-containing protein n=1 Tax=Rhypophila decipiens TaxID=261697 RepID=A0AAN6YN78_9PEZI|nr:Vps54-like protein-domain-containing protein [Rhypophila decipiens]
MFSNQGARMSVDSLSPTLQAGPRGDFPFHGKTHRAHSPQRPSHNRRGSTASSIHSIGGSLDTSSGSWSQAMLETGQNAISTLLQPPIVRTGLVPHTAPPTSSTHKPPTARDIPPVTLTNIPHVDASEFKSYLSQVGSLYEQLRRVQAEEEDAASHSAARRTSKADSIAEAVDDGHLRPGKRPGAASRRTSTASISSIASFEAPSPLRRSGASFRKGGAHGPPPLSTIPTVYFDENFHLENPRTFDVVSERSEVIRSTSGTDERASSNGHAEAPRKALATNAILQEKLSWYMDTIEMHLIQSISTASTTFFTALGSLRELHSEAAESVDRIRALRKELESLDEEIASRGLEIVQQRRRRENIQQLHDAVEQLREVVERLGTCESLVDAGEVDNALDCIDALEGLIAGEPGSSQNPRSDLQLRDLRGTSALQGINNDLDTLRQRVGKAYEAKMVATLIQDLRRHVQKVSTQEVLMRWNSASIRSRGGHGREPSAFPSYLSSIDDLRAELLPSLTGLQRAQYLTAAATAYREATLREVRNVIKEPLPSSNDDDTESMMSSSTMTGGKPRTAQEKAMGLARNLRALSSRDAEETFIKIYIGITETLRRFSTQVKVLLDVASSIGNPTGLSDLKSPIKSPPFSPTARRESDAGLEAQAEVHKALDASNLLGQAVDMAQDRIVRLLRARTGQSTHLSLIWFLRYFTLNLHFAIECEAISGRSGTKLKDAVNGHIKEFVTLHKDAEMQRLVEGMNLDQWVSTDFGDRDSELLGHILEGSTKNDPTWWTRDTKMWVPYDEDDEENQDAAGPDNGQDVAATRPRVRGAIIDEQTFHLPKSAILCMNGIGQFLHLIVGIPSVAVEISSSLIAYMSFFASRCYQLILAAGATVSAGLRHITTVNLAVASQALGFIATLIPHIREFVRRYCSSGTGANVSAVMAEYDKIRRTYQEHQNSIYDKLVEIMHRRAQVAAKGMRALNWENEKDTCRPVHEYMELLAKETTRLHKNLVRQGLPEDTVRMIMLPIFNSYKDTFGTVLQELEPVNESGRDSMIRDVEYLQSRMGKMMDGFEGIGEYLVEIIKAKVVVKSKTASPPHPLVQAQIGQSPSARIPSPSLEVEKRNENEERRSAEREELAASRRNSGELETAADADGQAKGEDVKS